MTPEAQVEAALKLLEPSFEKKAFCEGWITTALAAVDADKQQTRHEKDVASKIARLDLKTYRAAIKRAQRAFWSLPEGMRKKLGLLAALEQTALPDFAALIAVCDRALPSQLAMRAEFDRYSSATWAWKGRRLLPLLPDGDQRNATGPNSGVKLSRTWF